MRVGQLAKRTGLTVRTLHHYDEIGLLSPAKRTTSGYRLYDVSDVERLNRIVALRQLGMSLDEIRRCLDEPAYALPRVLRMRAGRMRQEIEEQRRVCERLERLADRLEATEPVSVDEHLEMIGALTMFEKYYTPEQLKQLEQRAQEVGEDRMRQVQEEWPKLIAEVRAAMEQGKDPASAEVQELGRRWKGLIAEFTGGDPGIAKSLNRMYQEESSARERAGIDPRLQEYVGRVLAAG